MKLSLPLTRLTAIALTLSLVFASLFMTRPAHGADPGESIFSFSGVLGTSSAATRTLNLNTSGPANLSLSVSGGVAGDSVVLTLLDSSNTALSPTWSAHPGETIWVAATLPAGGKVRLSTTAASLNVALNGYVRGSVTAPTEDGPILAGRLIGAGQSTSASGFTLTVPTAGLYRLSLEASSGAYQLVIGETVRKTVTATPSSPTPADSTYFLAAGSQNFQIIPDASTDVVTAWSIQITSVGGTDSLPYREASGALGGTTFAGGSFTTELVPLQLDANAEVNVSIAVQGDAADGLTVELLNGATPAYASGSIKGGETLWFTSQLTAGANALRVVAPAGNSGPLSYTIELRELAAPDLTLSGSSQGASALNSTVRVSFPTAGLYNFTLGASAGRYQLRLNDTFLRRIVTTEGSIFTAFVPAGTHELVVVQDSSGAAWSVAIAGTNQTSDTLPFSRSGVTLGDQFNEEWLPIALAEAGQVNIRLTVSGATPGDKLQLAVVRPGATSGFTLDQVFVGEELWATLNLESGASLLHLSVAGNNTALSYTLEVRQIAGVPASWSGIALDGGLSSNFTVEVPQNGVYTVTLTLSEGAGSLRIDAPTTPPAPTGAALASDIVLTQRVTLDAGQHTFTFDPDVTQPRTAWALDVSLLREIISLSLTPAEPIRLPFGQGGALELTGTGFDSTSTLVLVDADGELVTVEYSVASSTSIALTVPADLPVGSYTFRVTNANGEQVERTNALNITVTASVVYLPIVRR